MVRLHQNAPLNTTHSSLPVGPDYKCDETEFSCKTNYRCIPQWARCDGTNDCIDDSDEQGCGQYGNCVVWTKILL